MAFTDEIPKSFQKLMDEFRERARQADQGSVAQDALRQYVELEKQLLAHHQDFLQKLGARDPIAEAFADFSRMALASSMDLVKFQRQQRERWLEMQSSMLEARLSMLENLVSQLDPSGNDEKDDPGDP